MSGGARRTIGLGTAASLVLLLTVFVRPASAVVVACGQTITQNTVLSADVGPCPNNGIIVGASNITLDLGGHTVFGTPNTGDGAGVRIEQRTGVRVQNGTITQFDVGILSIGGGGHTFTGLRVVNNVGDANPYGDGIVLAGTDDTTISGNLISGNGPLSGVSIVRDDRTNPESPDIAERNLINGNSITNNFVYMPNGEMQDIGVRVEGGNRFTTITNNQISGNGLDGVQLFIGSTDNVVSRNSITRNGFHQHRLRKGTGIFVNGNSVRNTIEQNSVIGNAADGIRIQGAGPVFPSNRILFNRAFFNGTGQPNSVDIRDNTGPIPCSNNEYHGNQAGTVNHPCVLAP